MPVPVVVSDVGHGCGAWRLDQECRFEGETGSFAAVRDVVVVGRHDSNCSGVLDEEMLDREFGVAAPNFLQSVILQEVARAAAFSVDLAFVG